MTSQKTLKITLIRSLIGVKKSHIACVRGLGLHRLHETKEVRDTPENRGMVNRISYMLTIDES